MLCTCITAQSILWFIYSEYIRFQRSLTISITGYCLPTCECVNSGKNN